MGTARAFAVARRPRELPIGVRAVLRLTDSAVVLRVVEKTAGSVYEDPADGAGYART